MVSQWKHHLSPRNRPGNRPREISSIIQKFLSVSLLLLHLLDLLNMEYTAALLFVSFLSFIRIRNASFIYCFTVQVVSSRFSVEALQTLSSSSAPAAASAASRCKSVMYGTVRYGTHIIIMTSYFRLCSCMCRPYIHVEGYIESSKLYSNIESFSEFFFLSLLLLLLLLGVYVFVYWIYQWLKREGKKAAHSASFIPYSNEPWTCTHGTRYRTDNNKGLITRLLPTPQPSDDISLLFDQFISALKPQRLPTSLLAASPM